MSGHALQQLLLTMNIDTEIIDGWDKFNFWCETAICLNPGSRLDQEQGILERASTLEFLVSDSEFTETWPILA